MIRALLLALLLVSAPAFADEWSRTDYTLAGVAVVATVMDWSQTRYIQAHPNQFRETNSDMPEHPTTRVVDRWFVEHLAGRAIVAYLLPPTARQWMLGSIAYIEVRAVAHNYSIGIGFSF